MRPRGWQASRPRAFVEGISHDPIALRWIQNALGRPGPADPAFDPGCGTS